MKPQLLADNSRLEEIYNLRVEAWENSERTNSINRNNFPNGWSDTIDPQAFHWIVTNETNQIIASARLSLHNSLDELPYPPAFKKFNLPSERPFAFYTRMVVAHEYRSLFLVKKLDKCRIEFIKKLQLPYTVATCTDKRINSLVELGFEILGNTTIEYADIVEETALILHVSNILI